MTIATRAEVRSRRSYKTSGDVGTKLAKAAELTAQINALKEQLEPLRLAIQAHMELRALDTIKTTDATVTYSKGRESWCYSKKVEREELALKNLKNCEREDGTATVVLGKPYITVKCR